MPEWHHQHLVDLQTRQRQSPGDSWPPIHYEEGHNARTHLPSLVWPHHGPDHQRTLCNPFFFRLSSSEKKKKVKKIWKFKVKKKKKYSRLLFPDQPSASTTVGTENRVSTQHNNYCKDVGPQLIHESNFYELTVFFFSITSRYNGRRFHKEISHEKRRKQWKFTKDNFLATYVEIYSAK